MIEATVVVTAFLIVLTVGLLINRWNKKDKKYYYEIDILLKE